MEDEEGADPECPDPDPPPPSIIIIELLLPEEDGTMTGARTFCLFVMTVEGGTLMSWPEAADVVATAEAAAGLREREEVAAATRGSAEEEESNAMRLNLRLRFVFTEVRILKREGL